MKLKNTLRTVVALLISVVAVSALAGCEATEGIIDNARESIGRLSPGSEDASGYSGPGQQQRTSGDGRMAGIFGNMVDNLEDYDTPPLGVSIYYNQLENRGIPVTYQEFVRKYEEIRDRRRGNGEYPDDLDLGNETKFYFLWREGITPESTRGYDYWPPYEAREAQAEE